MRFSTTSSAVLIAVAVSACSVGEAELLPAEGRGSTDGGMAHANDHMAQVEGDDGVTGGGSGGAAGGDAGGAGGSGGLVVGTGGSAVEDAGVPGCAGVTCQANARCTASPAPHCECISGFVANGAACVANLPGNPALHVKAEVCQAWQSGHVENAQNGGFSVSTATCDPGTVSREGLDDALRRLNMLRWLAGLGPVTDDPGSDVNAQGCALISAWNPAGPTAHFPQPSAACFNQAGAAGAGSSNIAWGCGTAAGAMDQWFDDWGNETTYGHRRWLLEPGLDGVGIGLYRGGDNYGSASCITVFGGGNPGPSPAWVAWPAPGYVPSALISTQWTVQGNVPGGATVTVTRQSDGQVMNSSVVWLDGSYGNSSAIRIDRSGWSPAVGETYHVKIAGASSGAAVIEYDLMPTQC